MLLLISSKQKVVIYMIKFNRNISQRIKLLVIGSGLLVGLFSFIPNASALTYLSKTSVILTNMNQGGASSVIVEFTTSASNTGTNGSVVFSGWTGSGGTGTVATSQTVSNTYNSVNCTTITGASANLPGSPTAAGTAGTGTISVTDATALTASTSYCYVLTSGITANPTSTGQTTVSVTAGSDQQAQTAINIISNDQVTVAATVPPSFTMVLSTNNDNFSSALSTASVGSTVLNNLTATINTNAKNGWYLWGNDANTGVKSTTQSYTIASKTPGTNGTITAGTDGFVTAITGITQGTGAGTTTAATAFSSSGSGNGSGLNTTPAILASSTGTAATAVVPIREYATIGALTPAATDYSDTLTFIGSGSF